MSGLFYEQMALLFLVMEIVNCLPAKLKLMAHYFSMIFHEEVVISMNIIMMNPLISR
jgi:hypothetical protein